MYVYCTHMYIHIYIYIPYSTLMSTSGIVIQYTR